MYVRHAGSTSIVIVIFPQISKCDPQIPVHEAFDTIDLQRINFYLKCPHPPDDASWEILKGSYRGLLPDRDPWATVAFPASDEVTCALFRSRTIFSRLQDDPPTGVSGAPTDNNIMIWNAVIFGPHDTPFEDGTFKLTIEFTEEYPNKPPTVRFVSRMFHPNVYADGGICLDILQNRWSPTYDVSAILTSIQVSGTRANISSSRYHSSRLIVTVVS